MSEEKDIVAQVRLIKLSGSLAPFAIDKLEEAASEIQRLRGEVERLTGREAGLLSANNRYLMRARDAEAVLADLLKFASGVETTAAYPTFQRARATLTAIKGGE